MYLLFRERSTCFSNSCLLGDPSDPRIIYFKFKQAVFRHVNAAYLKL